MLRSCHESASQQNHWNESDFLSTGFKKSKNKSKSPFRCGFVYFSVAQTNGQYNKHRNCWVPKCKDVVVVVGGRGRGLRGGGGGGARRERLKYAMTFNSFINPFFTTTSKWQRFIFLIPRQWKGVKSAIVRWTMKKAFVRIVLISPKSVGRKTSDVSGRQRQCQRPPAQRGLFNSI